MFGVSVQNLIDLDQHYYSLEDYRGNVPRGCPGCGDNAILASVQKICRDEQLPLENEFEL